MSKQVAKTYQEVVWQLALDSAHNLLNGGYDKWPDGITTIAWIYGVSVPDIEDAMKSVEADAWKAAQKGVK